MKILPVGVELFHADIRTDEQTDMTKLIVPCRNFTNAPKNEIGRGYYKQPREQKMRASYSVTADLLFRDIWHVSRSPM